jgi:hypothetical protein
MERHEAPSSSYPRSHSMKLNAPLFKRTRRISNNLYILAEVFDHPLERRGEGEILAGQLFLPCCTSYGMEGLEHRMIEAGTALENSA